MVPFIEETFVIIRSMGEEFSSIRSIIWFMRENGMMINPMEKENKHMVMEILMLAVSGMD